NQEMRAEYTYDYNDRRILKQVWPNLPLSTNSPSVISGQPASVVYVSPTFEIRDHDAPTKYIFNGASRIAHVTGSLSSNARIQRFRVFPGWNLCSLAVTATNALTQLASGNPQLVQAAYQWSGAASNWTAVNSGATLPAGTVLWLNAATN